MRVYMLAYFLVSGGIFVWLSTGMAREEPFTVWVLITSVLIFLCLLIAINELPM